MRAAGSPILNNPKSEPRMSPAAIAEVNAAENTAPAPRSMAGPAPPFSFPRRSQPGRFSFDTTPLARSANPATAPAACSRKEIRPSKKPPVPATPPTATNNSATRLLRKNREMDGLIKSLSCTQRLRSVCCSTRNPADCNTRAATSMSSTCSASVGLPCGRTSKA